MIVIKKRQMFGKRNLCWWRVVGYNLLLHICMRHIRTYYHPQFKSSSSSVFPAPQTHAHTHMRMAHIKHSFWQSNSEPQTRTQWKMLWMQKDLNKYSKQEQFHGITSICMCLRGLFFGLLSIIHIMKNRRPLFGTARRFSLHLP